MTKRKVTALRIEQPGGIFYTFKISAKELLHASYISRRSENPKGIQRILKKSRLKRIKDFIESEDALFPNSIIVNIEDSSASFKPIEKESPIGYLEFSTDPESVMIIDGQHRLHGFEDERTEKDFEVLVTAFMGEEAAKTAMIFYKVNKEAKPVNTSLALDLLGLIGPGEDFFGYQLHGIISKLNKDSDSPLRESVSMTDVKEQGKPFTQANLSTKIKWFVKNSPQGRVFLINDDEVQEKPLVNLIKTYFSVIKDYQEESWRDDDSLIRTNLILGSLIYMLPKVIYATQVRDNGKVSVEGLKKTLKPIEDIDFSSNNEEFTGLQGEAGMKEISAKIAKELNLDNPEDIYEL